ncbi:PIN domain-containing protein [Armatimonas rosea]|uniref:PIN domain-containing protein n=1 Tax=Armatimonas rosea TaxID=685828 RepID=UPI00161360A2|nr:PIN domain-containing protein [Armatimonas rosea]
MRTNYILIDLENIHPETLVALEPELFHVIVFVGANQTKIAFDTAMALQKKGDKAEYVKVSGTGHNALDFHIAFYLGQLATADPTGFFHILSKDTGFDPLLQHLKARKIFVGRVSDISEISAVKVANVKTTDDKIAAIVSKLQQMKSSKPRTVNTLARTISALFQKQLPENDISALVTLLEKKKLILVTDTKVTYSLPAA